MPLLKSKSSPPLLLPHGSRGEVEVATCCMKSCITCLIRFTLKSNIFHCMAQGSYHLGLHCRGVKVPSLVITPILFTILNCLEVFTSLH